VFCRSEDVRYLVNYRESDVAEDMELLSSVDKSLQSAMDALGADLFNYLEEAEKGKKEEEEPKKDTFKVGEVFEPFAAVGKGFSEIFKGILPALPKLKKGEEKEKPNAEAARGLCWVHYNIFKKAHGLLSW